MPETTPALPKAIRDKLQRMAAAFTKIDQLLFRLGQQGLQRMTPSSTTELLALQQTAHSAALINVERKLDALATLVQRYLDRDPLFTMKAYMATLNAVWMLNNQARKRHQAGQLPAEMIDVIGQARRTYERVEQTLLLQPLGASGWVTDTDFVGITIYFYVDGRPGEIYQASNCKPTAYFGSDPRRLMRMEISDHVPFTIHEMSHGAFALDDAKLSGDGRLSLHRELRVRRAPYIGGRAYQELAVGSWGALLDRLRASQLDPLRGGGGGGSQLAFIEPSAWGEVKIDDKQARCTVELGDTAGASLQIEMPLRAENNFLIDNLERMLSPAGRKAGLVPEALFGRAWTAEGRLRFFPLTAIYNAAVLDRSSGRRLNEIHLSLEDLKQVKVD